MTEQAREALLASIKHWEEMRDDPLCSTPGADNCPLCKEFASVAMGRCSLCPVKEFTGHNGCSRTPYRAAREMWFKKYTGEDLGPGEDKWIQLAQDEIDFLKSLL